MLKKSRRSGFTLPEILVTVTVIAVRSAVVVPAVVQYTNKGDTPASQQDVQQIQNAVTGFTAEPSSAIVQVPAASFLITQWTST